jgi:hypothetical protein
MQEKEKPARALPLRVSCSYMNDCKVGHCGIMTVLAPLQKKKLKANAVLGS